ncbi:MAG: hypothetical protein WCE81_10085 [Halobacteriota archaeon]
MLTVSLYQMFNVKTLRYRESAQEVVERLPKRDTPVIIDFANIEFASRSFLHELLQRLGNRQVTFKHRNETVEKMMEIIERKTVHVAS